MIKLTTKQWGAFVSSFSVADDSDCWPWQGRLNGSGYGVLPVGRRDQRAHRIMWEVANGESAGPCIMHACDNPPCVNPAHLSSGTMAENQAGMAARNRSAHGERNGCAKLTAQDVKDIVALHDDGFPQASLARDFGINASVICDILHGHLWARVTGITPIRPGIPSGERHGNTTLTAAQVLEICARLDAGDTGESLAVAYATTRSTISRIKLGHAWSDVTGR